MSLLSRCLRHPLKVNYFSYKCTNSDLCIHAACLTLPLACLWIDVQEAPIKIRSRADHIKKCLELTPCEDVITPPDCAGLTSPYGQPPLCGESAG